MGTATPVGIVGLRGQVVNAVRLEGCGVLRVHCRRDERYRLMDSRTAQSGRVNRWLRRTVSDVPKLGYRMAFSEIG